ncbi:MAG TPA: FAD-dependent oxidoreductase [Solirubrobacteraceae bacterium]|nr:FAD-dependent oxidoreductase [Solirubrobacteraceae bacterium]
MSDSGDAKVRVAIIGSGPAGSYTAGHLLRHTAREVHVDLYERLPTPWGLVRAGVAPDHPKIKSVTNLYERTAEHPRLRLFANVEFGKHLTLADYRRHYHAIVYAVGTPTDRAMGIPGEDLRGSYSATDFVGWYNGHPDFRDREFELGGERVVVIGAGNVALDVARMLVLTRAELAGTDIADHALDVLTGSGVREVLVVARRGAAQAAFTNPELRELAELADADVLVDPAELALGDAFADPDADASAKRNVEILRAYSAQPPAGRTRRVALRFLLSPVELTGTDRVESVTVVRNTLEAGKDGSLRARATDERLELPADAVFRAIGYRGTPLADVPFDAVSGLISNEGGRVRRGEYVVGWAKRGPSGVIGTNKKDANDTVDRLLEDLAAGRLLDPPPIGDAALEAFVRGRQPQLVDYEGWVRIDRHERGLGEPAGRPRVKLTRLEEMLDAVGNESGG